MPKSNGDVNRELRGKCLSAFNEVVSSSFESLPVEYPFVADWDDDVTGTILRALGLAEMGEGGDYRKDAIELMWDINKKVEKHKDLLNLRSSRDTRLYRGDDRLRQRQVDTSPSSKINERPATNGEEAGSASPPHLALPDGRNSSRSSPSRLPNISNTQHGSIVPDTASPTTSAPSSGRARPQRPGQGQSRSRSPSQGPGSGSARPPRERELIISRLSE
eukprot:CAMPEP_0196665484 /NCGR_PEP_ID=MMETSP1086-20130531/61290_1 /TAXON_ID=77921 /ORGANISM="Cyanoptyche  gloeocystis , Strain SAG4.97" /LENGTH=218 /DNA_ID=CAMNT_0042002271 /DNA_START=12 /DNA_END=665 /DNA_ORIENTATION=+